jgi:hypothetical protein
MAVGGMAQRGKSRALNNLRYAQSVGKGNGGPVGFWCYDVGMKEPADAIQYTIRGIPRDVDRALRQKAKRHKKSLNQVVVDELTAAAGSNRKYADFSDLVGKWTPDPEFDEIIAAQRQIDPDLWK